MNEFKTPRFVISAFFSVTMTIGYFFTDKMTTGEYISVMTAILGAWFVRKVLANRKG